MVVGAHLHEPAATAAFCAAPPRGSIGLVKARFKISTYIACSVLSSPTPRGALGIRFIISTRL